MGKEVFERVRQAFEEDRAIDEVRSDLVSEGYMEEEVLDAIQNIKGTERSQDEKKNISLLTVKEILDRIGYGFASVQFINILFYLTGAGFFLIGIINGLRTILSLVISSFLEEYSKVREISKKFLSKAGIFFGISFLFIAMAVVIKSLPLFAIALLAGSIGVVTYGDLYNKLVEQTLKKEKMSKFLLRISHYGVLITGASLLIAGFLFDKFPMFNATKLVLFGKSLPLYGYLISFEITAIVFILSGYVLHYFKEKKVETEKVKEFVSAFYNRIREQTKLFVKNKYLLTLLFASSITGLVQILGNSFYGIFIYKQFQFAALGGFMNVAMIFTFAIVVSFLGPMFSKFLNKKVGLAPTLVFGTLLIAMMPLVSAYNPHFLSVSVANALSVLGAAILGMGQGLLLRKLLPEEKRKIFFAALSIAIVIPFIILIPIGSWVAQTMGLIVLFKILAFVLLILAAPIYFILVLMANKLRL
ncbi:MAG: MFS transporter [Nanoarchaeota archaeon]|nr:MFS transporter [Nanoarchaeota archaeon]MBU1322259.1 MFS transporter [Nanoarchaeota archaeon]MBU1598239.1 MFS transporter [Nanoarchaeota archaeon]MBU2441992.1 MFS transporter [Nanoarchaeota archaeon]